jgi:hypothetical protein
MDCRNCRCSLGRAVGHLTLDTRPFSIQLAYITQYLDRYGIKEADVIASLSSYVIPALLSAVIIWGVYRLVKWETQLKSLPNAGVSASIGQTDLQVIIGSGNNYHKVESVHNRVTKTVLVGVKNNNPNRYLSNCNLYVRIPNDDVFHPLNTSRFSLNHEEERFFEVAYRHEYINAPKGYIDSIQFSIPDQSGGTFWDGGLLYCVPRGAYFITLKAEAFESKPYEVVCKLWVDDNGTLRLAKV